MKKKLPLKHTQNEDLKYEYDVLRYDMLHEKNPTRKNQLIVELDRIDEELYARMYEEKTNA